MAGVASAGPNPPARHHYIPEFFLNQWTSAVDLKLQSFRLVHSGKLMSKRVYPSQAGYEKHLYSLPFEEEPWRAAELETKFFSVLDDKAAKVFERLLEPAKWKWDSESRFTWSIFIMSLMHRTPSNLKQLVTKYIEFWHTPDPILQAKYEECRRAGDPEQLEQFLKDQDPEVARKAAYRMLPKLIASPLLGTHLANTTWQVVDVEESSCNLLISDNPVIMKPMEWSDGHIAFPISPMKLFLASSQPWFWNELGASTVSKLTKSCNKLLVRRAEEIVIATDNSQRTFIEKHFGRERIGGIMTGFAPSE